MSRKFSYYSRLNSQGLIDDGKFINMSLEEYQRAPELFTDDQVTQLEKRAKALGVDFKRNLEDEEAKITGALNQLASGIVEGFTTFGWADDPKTQTEALLNKMGHLIGFAPDIIAGVLTFGASFGATSAKIAGKQAIKASRLAAAGRKIQEGLEYGGKKIPILASERHGSLQLRSVPMKAADWVVDQAKNRLGSTEVLRNSFLGKKIAGIDPKLLGIMEQSAHLSVAMAVSARKEGPEGWAQAAVHGAAAGAVFGGIAQYVNIGKALASKNPAELAWAHKQIRKASDVVFTEARLAGGMTKDKAAMIDIFARGSLGAAFTGGQTTLHGASTPDQVYEYLLGFFFGAAGRPRYEMEATMAINKMGRKIMTHEKDIDPETGQEVWKWKPENLKDLKEYKEASKEAQDYMEAFQADFILETMYNRPKEINDVFFASLKEALGEGTLSKRDAIAKALENTAKIEGKVKITAEAINQAEVNRVKNTPDVDVNVVKKGDTIEVFDAVTGVPVEARVTSVKDTSKRTKKEIAELEKLNKEEEALQKEIDKYQVEAGDIVPAELSRKMQDVISRKEQITQRDSKRVNIIIKGERKAQVLDQGMYVSRNRFNPNYVIPEDSFIPKEYRGRKISELSTTELRDLEMRLEPFLGFKGGEDTLNAAALQDATKVERINKKREKGEELSSAEIAAEENILKGTKNDKDSQRQSTTEKDNEVGSPEVINPVNDIISLLKKEFPQFESQIEDKWNIYRAAAEKAPDYKTFLEAVKAINKELGIDISTLSKSEQKRFMTLLKKNWNQNSEKSLQDSYTVFIIKDSVNKFNTREITLGKTQKADEHGTGLLLTAVHTFHNRINSGRKNKFEIKIQHVEITNHLGLTERIKMDAFMSRGDNWQVKKAAGEVVRSVYDESFGQEYIHHFNPKTGEATVRAIAHKDKEAGGVVNKSVVERFISEVLEKDFGKHLRGFVDPTYKKTISEAEPAIGKKKVVEIESDRFYDETLSNIIYELRDANLIPQKNSELTLANLKKGYNDYVKQQKNLYGSLAKYLQYRKVFENPDARELNVDYKKDGDKSLNVVVVNDGKVKVGNNVFNFGEVYPDGAKFYRWGLHDKIIKDQLRNPADDYIKDIIIHLPESASGKGLLIAKSGTQRPDEMLQQFMKANDIDVIIMDSSRKSNSRHDSVQLNYNKGIYSAKNPIKQAMFQINQKDVRLIDSEYDVPDSRLGFEFMPTQSILKRNISMGKDIDTAIEQMVNDSRIGDPKYFQEYQTRLGKFEVERVADPIRAEENLAKFLRVDKLPITEILRIANNELDTPLGRVFMRAVFESNKNKRNEIETSDIFESTEATKGINDLLAKFNYDPLVLTMGNNMNLFNASIRKHIMQRLTRPRSNSAFGFTRMKALTPHIAATSAKGLNDTNFFLYEGHANKPIYFKGGVSKDMPKTLGEAWDLYQKLSSRKTPTDTDVNLMRLLEDKILDMVVIRNPVSAPSGITVLRFGGFIKGTKGQKGIIVSKKTAERLGGADYDGDAVGIYMDVPSNYKKTYKNPKVANTLDKLSKTGGLTNPNHNIRWGFEQKKGDVKDIFNPLERLKQSVFNSGAVKNIGVITNFNQDVHDFLNFIAQTDNGMLRLNLDGDVFLRAKQQHTRDTIDSRDGRRITVTNNNSGKKVWTAMDHLEYFNSEAAPTLLNLVLDAAKNSRNPDMWKLKSQVFNEHFEIVNSKGEKLQLKNEDSANPLEILPYRRIFDRTEQGLYGLGPNNNKVLDIDAVLGNRIIDSFDLNNIAKQAEKNVYDPSTAVSQRLQRYNNERIYNPWVKNPGKTSITREDRMLNILSQDSYLNSKVSLKYTPKRDFTLEEAIRLTYEGEMVESITPEIINDIKSGKTFKVYVKEVDTAAKERQIEQDQTSGRYTTSGETILYPKGLSRYSSHSQYLEWAKRNPEEAKSKKYEGLEEAIKFDREIYEPMTQVEKEIVMNKKAVQENMDAMNSKGNRELFDTPILGVNKENRTIRIEDNLGMEIDVNVRDIRHIDIRHDFFDAFNARAEFKNVADPNTKGELGDISSKAEKFLDQFLVRPENPDVYHKDTLIDIARGLQQGDLMQSGLDIRPQIYNDANMPTLVLNLIKGLKQAKNSPGLKSLRDKGLLSEEITTWIEVVEAMERGGASPKDMIKAFNLIEKIGYENKMRHNIVTGILGNVGSALRLEVMINELFDPGKPNNLLKEGFTKNQIEEKIVEILDTAWVIKASDVSAEKSKQGGLMQPGFNVHDAISTYRKTHLPVIAGKKLKQKKHIDIFDNMFSQALLSNITGTRQRVEEFWKNPNEQLNFLFNKNVENRYPLGKLDWKKQGIEYFNENTQRKEIVSLAEYMTDKVAFSAMPKHIQTKIEGLKERINKNPEDFISKDQLKKLISVTRMVLLERPNLIKSDAIPMAHKKDFMTGLRNVMDYAQVKNPITPEGNKAIFIQTDVSRPQFQSAVDRALKGRYPTLTIPEYVPPVKRGDSEPVHTVKFEKDGTYKIEPVKNVDESKPVSIIDRPTLDFLSKTINTQIKALTHNALIKDSIAAYLNRLTPEQRNEWLGRSEDTTPILPVDLRRDIDTTKSVLTEGQVFEIRRFLKIIEKNPQIAETVEGFFAKFSSDFGITGKPYVGKVIQLMSGNDLRMFNNYLEDAYISRGSMFQKFKKWVYEGNMGVKKGEVIEAPKNPIKRVMHYFFTEHVGKKYLEPREMLEHQTHERVVEDIIEGEIVPTKKTMVAPTNTQELTRRQVDEARKFSAAFQDHFQQKLKNEFEEFDVAEGKIKDYMDELVEIAVDLRVYDNGNYGGRSGFYTKRSKEIFEDSAKKSQKRLEEIEKEVPEFEIKELVEGLGKRKKVTGTQAVELINKKITDFYQVFVDQLITKGMRMTKEGEYEFSEEAIKKVMHEFSDKNGEIYRFIDFRKINKRYKKQQRAGLNKIEMLMAKKGSKDYDNLIGLNELLMYRYEYELVEYLKSIYPKFDPANKNTHTPEVLRDARLYRKHRPMEQELMSLITNKGKSDPYWHFKGHLDFSKNRDNIDNFIESSIKSKWTRDYKDGGLHNIPLYKMPQAYRKRVEAEEINPDTGKKWTIGEVRRLMLSDYGKQIGVSLQRYQQEGAGWSDGLVPFIHSHRQPIANTKVGAMKERSKDIMPGYSKTLDVLGDYATNMVKAYTDNMAALRGTMLIDRFVERNALKDMDHTNAWANFMRDGLQTMLNLNTFRSLELSGIKKSEVKVLKKFIENNLEQKDKLGYKHRRFLQLVEDYIAPDVHWYNTVGRGLKGKPLRDAIHAYRMARANELLDPKNINKIKRFGTMYHFTSDEAAVNFIRTQEERIGKLFGYKEGEFSIWKELRQPKKTDEISGRTVSEEARRIALARKLKAWSNLEGKFEMLSLLFHPKTMLANYYGGGTNIYADTGWTNFKNAMTPSYLLKEVFANAKFKDPKTGKMRNFETMGDIEAWLAKEGFLEGMYLEEAGINRNFQTANEKKFAKEVIKKLFGRIEKDATLLENPRELDKIRTATILELSNRYNIDDAIMKFGSYFMRTSEIKLRRTAALAHYLNARRAFEPLTSEMAFDSPLLLEVARRGIISSQYVYHSAFRTNYANTSLGRVMTRFHPYAWNSVRRRRLLYKGSRYSGWFNDTYANQVFQRQLTADTFSMAMAIIYAGTLFEYALSPPMSWMQDTSQWLFGDEKDRERAFFSQWPTTAAAPLQIATPPIARFVLPPLKSLITNDFENMVQYNLATYAPGGRMFRDVYRTAKNPEMAVDFLTGIPIHRIGREVKNNRESWEDAPDEQIEEQPQEKDRGFSLTPPKGLEMP